MPDDRQVTVQLQVRPASAVAQVDGVVQLLKPQGCLIVGLEARHHRSSLPDKRPAQARRLAASSMQQASEQAPCMPQAELNKLVQLDEP